MSGPLLLESQAVVSHTMWVPSANNKYSELLSLLSNLRFDFFFLKKDSNCGMEK